MPIAGADRTMDLDVAIVGAGAAGLAAGRHLSTLRPDLRLQLFEAGRRIGGRAHTVEAGPDHLPLDLGCGWLHGGRDNAWAVIAARTGFTLDRSPAPWDGGRRDIGPSREDQASARQALEGFFERAEQPIEGADDRSLADLLLPGQRWNGLIGAIGTFINGAELGCASLLDYQRYDPGRGPDPRVREGYGRLVATYGAGLPVALDTPVHRIEHGRSDILLDTAQGVIRARAVIVAVPTNALAAEQLRFDPPLPDKVSAAADLPLGLANKLFLSVPEEVDLPVEHHLMASVDSERTGAYHLRPFGRPVVEGYFGGTLARDLERQGLAAAADFAHSELGRHLGAETARQLQPLAWSNWATTPFVGGSYSYAKPGSAHKRAVLAAPVDGRLFFAGEACAPHRFSTAHGAFETGVTAAEAAAGALPKA